jgi:hypothetical protein
LDESQRAIQLPLRPKKPRPLSGNRYPPPPKTPPPPQQQQQQQSKPTTEEIKKPCLDSEEEAEFFDTRLLPLVAAIRTNPGTAVQSLKTIYAALDERGYFLKRVEGSGKKRTPVVRLLSPFVDDQNPEFLLHLARILLALKLRGNNLTNVWKLVFKIARSDKNDHLFLEDGILDLIIESVGSLDPVEDADPCIYAYGALKFLTTNPELLGILNMAGVLQLMILHLRLLVAEREAPTFASKSTTTSSREQMGQVLYQLTGGFRNVVGGGAPGESR